MVSEKQMMPDKITKEREESGKRVGKVQVYLQEAPIQASRESSSVGTASLEQDHC